MCATALTGSVQPGVRDALHSAGDGQSDLLTLLILYISMQMCENPLPPNTHARAHTQTRERAVGTTCHLIAFVSFANKKSKPICLNNAKKKKLRICHKKTARLSAVPKVTWPAGTLEQQASDGGVAKTQESVTLPTGTLCEMQHSKAESQ